MKTSIIIKYITAIAIGSLLLGCSGDFLNEKNPNMTTDETYWQDESTALSALATVYSPVRGQMYGYFGAFTGFQSQNIRGEDVWAIHDDAQSWDVTVFQNDPNNERLADDWKHLYQSIGRANVFLANVDKAAFATDRENVRDQMKGEAHFLRGWNYFMLVLNWGAVPLRLDGVGYLEDAMIPVATEEQIWAQVESDFKEAKTLLPVTRPASEGGRITKGAAIAYLGKAYIFQNKMAEGKTELDLLMKDPYSYDLVQNTDDNYSNSNEFNQESIFELNYAKYGTGSWGQEGANETMGNVLPNFVGSPKTGGWFKLMPSASIIEEFFKEERPAGSETTYDKRLYTCFYFKYSDYGDVLPDATFYGENKYTFEDLWEDVEKGKITGENNPQLPTIKGKPGRFIPKKHTAFWLGTVGNSDSMYNSEPIDNNYRVMRFAEVLLLRAEAAAKTGDLATAIQDVNRIRKRAGLVDKTWGSAEEIMKEIEHQRLLEFWLEGHRFLDLKRWHGTGLKNVLVERKKQGAANFNDKHVFYPIPQTELNSNTVAKQNTAWQ